MGLFFGVPNNCVRRLFLSFLILASIHLVTPLNFQLTMTSRRTTARKGLSTAVLESWSEIKSLSLPQGKREKFSKRLVAIKLYAAHESLQEIKRQTGISKQQLYNLVERCITRQADGTMVGFRGLIPNIPIV